MATKKPSTATKPIKKEKTVTRVKKEEACDSLDTTWDIVDLLTERVDCDRWAVNNTVILLEEDNTVPFIARYRQEKTNNMEAEKIRQVKEELDNLKAVKHKIETVHKAVSKLGKVKPQWRQSLCSAQTMEEVEHLYAPFKPGSKRALAERARDLGLEPAARGLLDNPRKVNLGQLIQPGKQGLATLAEVKTGIQHILADIISKDKDVMDNIRTWCKTSNVIVTSCRTKAKSQTKSKAAKGDTKPPVSDLKLEEEAEKFKLYFDFSTNIKYIKPHQVLAINRGVSKKVLTMKVVIPSSVETRLLQLAGRRFVHPAADRDTRGLLEDSVRDAYSRLIEPLMARHYRSELAKTAEKASVEVFASNLRRLLLTPPVRGKVVLGVDPGFKHGCKCAVVAVNGQILDTGVFYLHSSSKDREARKIADIIHKHRCETVAIGNGTACRETEAFFSEQIKRRAYTPLRVQFCIVSESGASIYSASPEATKEMPNLDVTIRGAVSIARRLQDPMAELVKIEPKHIGVGMYQHDISESQLRTALDGVVEDCVSFVGVDLNVASEVLLKRIAGLSSAIAKKIVERRESVGPFICREQLTEIKGLGPKTYKQCAGFVRVLPKTRHSAVVKSEIVKEEEREEPPVPGKKRKATTKAGAGKSKKLKSAGFEPDPLDMTSVHPESYDVANRLITEMNLSKENIGEGSFIDSVKRYLTKRAYESLASEFSVGVPTLTLISKSLQQAVNQDFRDEFEKPLFKEGVRSFCDVRVGEMLTGRVTNTVHFGAFVDVGVGQDGLIHSSQISSRALAGKPGLELGDMVKVMVQNVDMTRKRLGLRLEVLL